ncbi:inositol 1,4,5-trisphosphate receptor-interacting protein [Synchiropus splendidus]|uniref:inositol 1,4,5-trisphosphate receptor-interacting protein n=1 Tax=Synchiropus splendidus TaxID=270530 RepID=UPI00237E22EE|nr:inositol 1,4,5-trisphosphate receptor-interacting protein [Synchiropus splendidus]
MQGAIARVGMVMVAAILNHPLLFPNENTTLPDQDEELISRMQEYEERLEREHARLELEFSLIESKQEEVTEDYSWYLWSALSFFMFFIIEMLRVQVGDAEIRATEDEDLFTVCGSGGADTVVLDKNDLSTFCDKCSYSSAQRAREFVEGFADDLLESLRSVCDRDTDMEVGDFVGVGSVFESWTVSKSQTFDLIVPFWPPDRFCFQFSLWCDRSRDIPPDLPACGVIEVTSEEDCLCGTANMGDDMLCLLHKERTCSPLVDPSPEKLLCSKNSVRLSKDQAMKWFQISVTKAWGQISHKYDFEVSFRNLDAAGALKIRFPSGKVILMNVIPAVQLDDTCAYFVCHFPSECHTVPDPYWPISFAVYERNLLKHFAKHLPQHSCHLHCLQIVTFLHRKQTGLTGECALTNYHWKTAVMHLLLGHQPSKWGLKNTERQLRDVLSFMWWSLHEKRLNHVLIGNPKVPEELQVPDVVQKAEPVNLFRSLVLHGDLHAAALRHFQEMVRNSAVLLQEYAPLYSG